MRNVQLSRYLSRPLHLALAALFLVSSVPTARSEDMPPDAAPPATSDISNEGVPPAPAMDPGMNSGMAGSAESEPAPEKPLRKKKSSKHAAKKKKAGKHAKKKAAKKKKKRHASY